MTDTAEIDQKEHHRLGTMGKWDPPEDDWAAEYDWTRYRGPDPWPVPGGWVFGDPEGGGWWEYFGDAGVGHHKKNGILDELKADDSVEDAYDAWDDLTRDYGQHASLTPETANPDEVSRRNPEDEQLEWTLEVDGTQVFRRVEPDRPDLMAAVAEALVAYHEGELEERREEIVPTRGRKPADVREQEEQERREEENESLDEFATDGGEIQEPENDHYDAVLRALEPGTLVAVNWSTSHGVETDEMEVEHSSDEETHVRCRVGPGEWMQIHRDRRGELVVSEVRDEIGSDHYCDVITLEIVGIESTDDGLRADGGTKQTGSERIPRCEECGVKHPWIRSLNSMVRVVNFECNECGRQQTRTLHTDDDDDGLRADGSGGTKYGDMLEGHEWDSPEDEGTEWRERTTAEADLEVTLHDEGYQTDRRWTVHIRKGHRDHPVAVYAAEHQNKGNFWREPELWRDAVDFVELPLAVRKRVASMLNRSVGDITPELRIHRDDGTGIGDRAGESSGTCEVCGGTIYDDESDTHEACEGGNDDV